jgi:hypothetical protein
MGQPYYKRQFVEVRFMRSLACHWLPANPVAAEQLLLGRASTTQSINTYQAADQTLGSDIVSAAQTIIGPPVHAFWLVWKCIKYVSVPA